jgi:hypothetical protein
MRRRARITQCGSAILAVVCVEMMLLAVISYRYSLYVCFSRQPSNTDEQALYFYVASAQLSYTNGGDLGHTGAGWTPCGSLWVWALMVGAIPLYAASVCAVAAWRTVNRRRLGLCIRCGYDVRQTNADRCPECGHDERGT